jgi:HSP20 family protein
MGFVKTVSNRLKLAPARSAHSTDRRENHNLVYQSGGGYQEVFLSSNKLVLMFGENTWQPPTDIYEIENEIIIKMEIAGIKPEETHINVNNDRVEIKGVRVDRESRNKRIFKQMEINYGQFQRVIQMHGSFDAQTIKATYKDGFLMVVISKAKKNKPVNRSVDITFEK